MFNKLWLWWLVVGWMLAVWFIVLCIIETTQSGFDLDKTSKALLVFAVMVLITRMYIKSDKRYD